jgi:hypothetical protein
MADCFRLIKSYFIMDATNKCMLLSSKFVGLEIRLRHSIVSNLDDK